MFAVYLALALTALFICGFFGYLYSFVLKWREARLKKQIQARERALRIVTIHNVAYNCDPLTVNSDGYQISNGIYPDSGGLPHVTVYDAPPPTYDEAMRANCPLNQVPNSNRTGLTNVVPT